MQPHRRVLYGMLVAAIFILPRGAQGQDFSGTWTTEVPTRVESRGGVESVSESATVTITLHQTGEAVHATWEMSPLPDRPNPPARELTGVVNGGTLVLTDTTEAQIRHGGEAPMTVQMINTIEATLDGDQLTGTQFAASVDGTISATPRPFSATRSR